MLRSIGRQSGEFVESSSLSLPFPSAFFPSLPLEVCALKYSYVWGSAVSSPSGVWGRAPEEIEFCAF